MPRGSCRNASARSAREPVSTVSANGRPLSAWKKVRRVPPAGSATRSRSFRVPSASGAEVRTVVTSRNAGPASVSSVQPVTVPTDAPGAVSPWRATRTSIEVRGPRSAAVAGALSQGASLRRVYVAGAAAAGRRSSKRCTVSAAPAAARRTAPLASPRPDGPHLDVRDRPRDLEPAVGALDVRQAGALVHDGPAGHRLGGDHERLPDAGGGERLLLLRHRGDQERRQAGRVRRRHAGALGHLVAGFPARHRAVGDPRRHQIGARRLPAPRAEVGEHVRRRGAGRGRRQEPAGQRGADADRPRGAAGKPDGRQPGTVVAGADGHHHRGMPRQDGIHHAGRSGPDPRPRSPRRS